MGNKVVSTKLSLNFFEQVFEPERKKLQNKLGMKVTQPNFTEFLFKNKVKFVLEKKDSKFLNKKLLRRKKI
jgi:hypothetical protein|tara:strand:- start:18 stop:230 length:213 start_codon:yes stop_codon:yes gene_type:complete